MGGVRTLRGRCQQTDSKELRSKYIIESIFEKIKGKNEIIA